MTADLLGEMNLHTSISAAKLLLSLSGWTVTPLQKVNP